MGKKQKWLVLLCVSLVVIVGIVLLLVNVFGPKKPELVELDEGIALDKEMAERLSEESTIDQWELYEDRKDIEKDVSKQVSKMIKQAKKQDVEGVLKYFSKEKVDYYKTGFEKSPEQLEVLAQIFENMELVFISPKNKIEDSLTQRSAEYLVEYEGEVFSVVLIYNGDKWLIESF